MTRAEAFRIYISQKDRNAEETKKLFEKYKPTHVIHLAAIGACQV